MLGKIESAMLPDMRKYPKNFLKIGKNKAGWKTSAKEVDPENMIFVAFSRKNYSGAAG